MCKIFFYYDDYVYVTIANIITGYELSPYCYVYTLKNPWYSYTQVISVTNTSNVVYSDAGYTWKLSQSVY